MSAKIVYGDDVGMIQAAGSARFLLEAAYPVGIFGESRRQNLHRDHAVESCVACAIHFAHAVGAQGRNDLVRTQAVSRGQAHVV